MFNDEDDKDYFRSAAEGLRPFSDFMWFAVDLNSHIAALTSAGFAAIPMVVFRSKTQYFSCLNYFESLPKKSEFTIHKSVYNLLTDWLEVASKGLFAYDWDNNSGCYEAGKPYSLLASPNSPITLSELPIEIQEYLHPIRFESLSFSKTKEIFLENSFPQNNWSVFYEDSKDKSVNR